MWCQNIFEGGLLVVEKTTGADQFRTPTIVGRNAGRGLGRPLRQHFSQAIVQSLVLEINRLHFSLITHASIMTSHP